MRGIFNSLFNGKWPNQFQLDIWFFHVEILNPSKQSDCWKEIYLRSFKRWCLENCSLASINSEFDIWLHTWCQKFWPLLLFQGALPPNFPLFPPFCGAATALSKCILLSQINIFHTDRVNIMNPKYYYRVEEKYATKTKSKIFILPSQIFQKKNCH